MDKHVSKRMFIAAGIPTPDYIVKTASEIDDEKRLIDAIKDSVGFPVVVKPNDQGSSVGLDIAHEPQSLFKIARNAGRYSDKIIFEKYIAGRELTVGILGEETLPIAEVRPHGGFYDYHHKYTAGMTDYLVPAPITQDQEKRIRQLGMMAFKALGCRGYARIDFRMSPDGEFYCLEVNTLPGMTQTSLVPKAAKAAGIDFPELLERIARYALDDFEKRKIA